MSCQGAVSPKGARKLHDADVVYLYDGSFEGFLCCVYESFAQHELPFAAVSYTHLRAHETDSYLVCRLLLEKKKK